MMILMDILKQTNDSKSFREANIIKAGFINVTSSCNMKTSAGMQPGDILYRYGHLAMYQGNGLIVEARGPKGHPETGDQTGNEISSGMKYRSEFTAVYRYAGNGVAATPSNSGTSSKDQANQIISDAQSALMNQIKSGFQGSGNTQYNNVINNLNSNVVSNIQRV